GCYPSPERGFARPRPEVVPLAPNPPQIFLGHVDATAAGIRLHVAHDIGQLEGDPEIDGVLAGPGVGIAEDLDAAEADRRGDAIAVRVELLEGLVGRAVEIHLDARD